MTNSTSSSDAESKRGNNGTSTTSESLQQQGDVPSATPPPQSQYPSDFSQPTLPQNQQQAYLQQLQTQNYYSYPIQTNTPTDQPNSPLPGSIGYDTQTAFQHQQQAAFFDRSYIAANPPQLPLTPSSNSNTHSHIVMPPLGVGPAVSSYAAAQGVFSATAIEQGSLAAPPSPGIGMTSGYINNVQGVPPTSPGVTGYSGLYPGYINPNSGMGPNDDRHTPLSPQPLWAEMSMQQQLYPQTFASPQFSSMPFTTSNMARSNSNTNEPARAQSFEELLPPSTISSTDSLEQFPQYQQNMVNGSAATNSSGTLFAHPQPWGYASAEIYSSSLNVNSSQHTSHMVPGSSSFPIGNSSPQGEAVHAHGNHRQSHHSNGSGSNGRGGYRNSHNHLYYQHTATTPGPPIQTTTSNKGPDGANLFIFHIPNHFTNWDMYKLFRAYGNLLSVRIMVEKDTGRSRGFGFVSYDTPESAATAIKQLNGYVIGNKRLKVQHKQIKSSDHNTNTPILHSEDATVFYGGHKEQKEPSSHEAGSQDQRLSDVPDSSAEKASVDIDDSANKSSLNHFDSLRDALPETS